MIRQIKTFTLNLIVAVNIAVVVLMVAVGYSDRLHPGAHPWLSCAGMAFPILPLINLGFLVFWVLFSWRRMVVPIVGFILAYIPIRIYMPLHFSQEPPPGSLMMVSYNVCGYGGNYLTHFAVDSVIDYVTRLNADIVCLQEDMNGTHHDVMARFAEHYPYNDTTRVSDVTNKCINSVGIHTRFPILRKEVIDYGSFSNGSVAYYLLVQGDTVLVINNHLESTHLSANDRQRYQEMIRGGMERDTAKAETSALIDKLGQAMVRRAKHVDVIHRYIESHRRYPMLVCGDFNDTPISYARHTMADGLTDCFVESGNGLGISFNQHGFNFRIDHLMCSHHFTPYNCKIDSKMRVSDHYPLLCWLKMAENDPK